MISRLELDELLRLWLSRSQPVVADVGSQGDPGSKSEASKTR
jgi:hypothetical protein